MQQRYQIFGMRGAGSLIAEFMLTAVGQDYDISFPKSDEMQQPAFRALNPLGKILVLVCPDGQSICEPLAINAHLLDVFPTLAQPGGSAAQQPYKAADRPRIWRWRIRLGRRDQMRHSPSPATSFITTGSAYDQAADF